MRTIGLVTTSRSDWGIMRPVAEAVRGREDLGLHIVAGGMHLSKKFGHTVDQIAADGFEVYHPLPYLQSGDRPEDVAASMGFGVTAFASLFAEWRPDILLVVADRFDMFPAVVAATPFVIPVAHIHGGEVTLGAFDDALRHAMTKLSHIHFAATEAYARRIRQMGEPGEHVHVVGAPGLDDLLRLDPLSDRELEKHYGFSPEGHNLLVVFHSETRSIGQARRQTEAVFDGLASFEAPMVIVRPNADTGYNAIGEVIDGFCARRPRARAVTSLPRRSFLSLMRRASAVVGNSSAGLVEAPSFGVPAVNVGERQAGRIRAANVIDCPARADAVATAVRRAIAPEFRRSLVGLVNPYGDGKSAERIARILASTPLGSELILNRFIDLPCEPTSDRAPRSSSSRG